MSINFAKAKRKIATLWFVYCALLFLLIFLQSISGKFEDKNQEAWGWFLALIMPNLTLMISVFAYDINNREVEISQIGIFFYRLTFSLSFFYLSAILLILLLQPLTEKSITQLMNESSIFLGPFQGLVSGSIGLFFVNKETK
jgi:hypothetical protein